MSLTRRNLLKAAAGSMVVVTLSGIETDARKAEKPLEKSKNQLKLGLFQHIPKPWRLEENFDVFLRALDAASASGVELLVIPECFLDGYAAPDKKSTRERLFQIAQEVGNSSYLDRVGQEAKNRRMSIVFGFTQKDGKKLYNAAGLWNAEGKLVGVYHKTHLQMHDKQYDPGESLPVFESSWGPLGIMICADRRWPETARVLRLQGARLILCPSYGMCHEANEWWMRTRSYENDCFVAFAHPEVGFVTNPDGNIVRKLAGKDEGVLSVEVDLSNADNHTHLDDRRPELYQIICRK